MNLYASIWCRSIICFQCVAEILKYFSWHWSSPLLNAPLLYLTITNVFLRNIRAMTLYFSITTLQICAYLGNRHSKFTVHSWKYNIYETECNIYAFLITFVLIIRHISMVNDLIVIILSNWMHHLCCIIATKVFRITAPSLEQYWCINFVLMLHSCSIIVPLVCLVANVLH